MLSINDYVDSENLIIPNTEPDSNSILQSIVELEEKEYFEKLQKEHQILSPKHTSSYLIEVFGKDVILEIIKDKVKELIDKRRSLTKYYNKKLAYFQYDHPRSYTEFIAYQLKTKISEIDTTFDRLAILYQAITQTKENLNKLSDSQIQSAREYPTHTLYDGRLILSGRNFKCLCPFHNEKTPSFYFYEDGGYHCFGCNKHGNNAVDYVIALEKLNFPDTIRRLA